MGSCTFRVGGAPQPAASTADSRRSAGSMGSVEDLAPLSGEQARALELVKGGKNIFFTGDLKLLCKWFEAGVIKYESLQRCSKVCKWVPKVQVQGGEGPGSAARRRR